MFDHSELGVLYTEHSGLRARPLASLWSYETLPRGRHRPAVALNRDGNSEYWLERSDPLLNTILPGTCVSVAVNFGDSWAAGRSLATSALLPRVAVIGPVTKVRILTLGARVHAVGAVLPATHSGTVFRVPASKLVDQIVPLDDIWVRGDVETLVESLSSVHIRVRMSALCRALVARATGPGRDDRVEHAASRLITDRQGRVSIERLANKHGISRQQFARQFSTATGMTPKLFARITRFQVLVRALLSSDVSHWASVAAAVGFYDQAHMINDFRQFAGAPPTVFFQPHGDTGDVTSRQLRGRPSEWQRISPNDRVSQQQPSR
jgi:AraC-like DNA-binding protein